MEKNQRRRKTNHVRINDLKKELRKKANPEKSKTLARFFKTGPGEYGEGDVFLGVPVPEIRKTIGKFADLGPKETGKMLESEIHEERLAGLLMLVRQYENGDDGTKKKIYEFCLKNAKRMNGWDLVDLTAPKIVGDFLTRNPERKKAIYDMALSENLWERRISMVSTLAFMRKKRTEDVFSIAEILIRDEHDLIQKAVGWMLREAGKIELKPLEDFLKKHREKMPSTTLRYAIEKFPEGKRKNYLKGIT